ncbi:hypothetical protein GGI12_004468 [Dipsacomyces acuminosporus]|nr:hypothetical protein GGI12_004468 [Dipsacomyces acuminosporus]
MLIKRFGDIVLKMFPNATERAFCTFPTKKHDKHDKRWIQQLLMQMSTDVAGLQYDIHGYEIELEGFVPYSGLARIRIQMDSLKAAHLELVRRNADTLESIHIGTIDAVMAGFLVRKHGGSLVTYPQLKCLLISARRNRHVDGGNSPRGMPFPNLRYLICREHYPFDNGILFRGNSGTLEKLVIGVDESALANWTFSNLLISGTHKKLNTVTVFTYRKGKQMLLPKKRVPELLQVTFRLPPTVQQLKLYTKCTLGGYAALTGIRATEKPYGLRVLDMYHTHFTLKQAAELVRAMPLLEKLTIVLVRDEGKAAISKGDIEQLHSQYYPISKRLRILEHGDFDSDAARGYSLGMLVFASLAPSLCLIRAHEKPKPRFLCDLKEAAQDPLLAPFTKHLSALRFTMLPGYPGVPPDYTQVANFT